VRKLILKMSTSLNGFVGDPNGKLDWMLSRDDAGSKAWQVARAWNASLHLMGRRTFYDMKAAWPASKDDYAAPMNQIPKAYFTRGGGDTSGSMVPAGTGENAGDIESWNDAMCLIGDLAKEVRKLKETDGKPIIAWGGADFARNLIPTGLVDEFQFLVFPVVLPAGLEIWSQAKKPFALKLVALEKFDNDVVAKTFHPG
jgi:dihydrofolate reductase